MRMHLIAALAGAIGANGAAPAAAPYHATGTEPFWSLTIDSRITYDPAVGRTISARTPQPQIGIAGETYRTPFIVVDVLHARCNDGMSDKVYPDTVNVRIGLKQLKGCGGASGVGGGRAPEPPAPTTPDLDGTSWTPLTIDNRPLFQMARAHVGFDRRRVLANVGCNNASGAYRVDRGRIYAASLTGTKMACTPAVLAQDKAFAALLRDGAEVRLQPGSKLELVGPRHKATLTKAR